jgi:hypothetical protein
MNREVLLGREWLLSSLWLVPALVLLMTWSAPAAGAERMVLCEEFANNG